MFDTKNIGLLDILIVFIVVCLVVNVFVCKEYFVSSKPVEKVAGPTAGKTHAPEMPVVLTKDNIDGYEDGTYVLLYLAPWCGHCQQFKEKTNNFQEFCNKHPGKLLTVDPYSCGIDGIIERGRIEGFPAICIIKNGEITEHRGIQRTSDALCELYESHATNQN
jgi:thiol-disulfide isomerase/thioredoxin